MDITVHKTVVMHVCYSRGDLSEDKKQARCAKVGLAELLPKANVLRTLRLKHQRIAFAYLNEISAILLEV